MFRTSHHPDARRASPRSRHHRARRALADLPFGVRGMFGRERWGRGQLIRRGEIRPLIVAALTTKPMHGYEVIQALEAQSGGRWRPSAGSVYPTLQLLADEGLVTSEEVDGRRTYTLTDAGRADAAANPAPGRGPMGRPTAPPTCPNSCASSSAPSCRSSGWAPRRPARRASGSSRTPVARSTGCSPTMPASPSDADGLGRVLTRRRWADAWACASQPTRRRPASAAPR